MGGHGGGVVGFSGRTQMEQHKKDEEKGKNSGKEVDAYIQKILFIHTESSFPCSFRQEIKIFSGVCNGEGREEKEAFTPLGRQSVQA